MRQAFIILVVALIAVGCGSGADAPVDDSSMVADDESTQAANADTPTGDNEDVAAFFARFKSTVRANDAEAVANMAEFPFELGGMSREQFLSDYYPTTLGDGDFRNRLLAASPAALSDEGDGRFSFAALVSDCGEMEEEVDCESAAVFYFARNDQGHWRLVDMTFAG